MSKLTKKDKLNIYKEWTIENKRSTYLSKKYGIGSVSIKYLVSLIHRHGMDILDKPHTYYSAQFKLEAINRVLVNHEAAYSVSLELGLKSQGMLINWIRSYKENGYNVVIKRKGRRTREQRTREIEERKRRIASPEFKAYCRERIYKKIECLGSKEKKPTKTEIAQAVRELRLELGLGVKTILSILNDLNNDLPGLSRSNYYDILKREDQDEIRHHSLIKRIK
ncbi:IS3 family transposase, partial [Lactobacillus gasseri]|nr:IS3 family transposase [Lactobacillus gasseri]MCZ3583873.1 IS3 family transposase [Lactobacillus gasseri]MCZ3585658.1 IS3 family transposase [Lactobacillus gasseri]MCZ3589280.1 IS3 family transposase [Lactobacillus gasseri]MCZ3595010.1 IS3 family transposase [Lactobacillus gasseri]